MTRRQAANESVFPQRRVEPGMPCDAAPSAVSSRIDPPHPMRIVEPREPLVGPASDPAVPPASLLAPVSDAPYPYDDDAADEILVVPSLPDDLRSELERQATELSAHLRRDAQDVDRRESRLHAQWANAEQHARSVNLCLAERSAELDERHAALDARERELEQRAASIAGAERFLDAARRDLEQQVLSAAANKAAAALEDRTKQISGGKSVAPSGAAPMQAARADAAARWVELEQAAEELRQREKRHDEREQRQHAREREVEELRLQLLGQRRLLDSQQARQRDLLERQTASVERTLARRLAKVEQRRADLEKLHAQVKARHRDALQLQLAIESLCRDVAGPQGAKLLERASCEAGESLAAADQAELAEREEQRERLTTWQAELAQYEAQLVRQRDKLAAWHRRRMAESSQAGSRPLQAPERS